MAESETRVSRETRLLILVIGVAVVVLFVLAQVRFPEAEVRLSTVTPAGLDRLAAKSNYDDLASAVKTAMQAVEASVVVFEAIGVPANRACRRFVSATGSPARRCPPDSSRCAPPTMRGCPCFVCSSRREASRSRR